MPASLNAPKTRFTRWTSSALPAKRLGESKSLRGGKEEISRVKRHEDASPCTVIGVLTHVDHAPQSLLKVLAGEFLREQLRDVLPVHLGVRFRRVVIRRVVVWRDHGVTGRLRPLGAARRLHRLFPVADVTEHVA
ncbi:hypothetical protein EYF80_044779 [Liparis tanakae]|uniref:Uncharacterized protein n=1 Tax=Liparis tanakae TaxID=230148 RepID=A0A4Z2FXH3_9TELE|nr:hypothetical protein EYF80_044779 [Liparis tanakae]